SGTPALLPCHRSETRRAVSPRRADIAGRSPDPIERYPHINPDGGVRVTAAGRRVVRTAGGEPMTMSGPARMVRCPTCMDTFNWIDTGVVWLYNDTKRQYEAIDISDLEPVKQAATRRDGYYLCPNPSRDAPEHYLPASYATYDDPLVVGL